MVTLTLTITLCDISFKFMSSHNERQVRERHRTTLEAIDTIHDNCAQPLVLNEWGFSEENYRVIARQLGVFTGYSGLQQCPLGPPHLRDEIQRPALKSSAGNEHGLVLGLKINRTFQVFLKSDQAKALGYGGQ